MRPSDRLDLLTTIAEQLYGDRWRHAIARALGPYHPGGERDSIDERLVRRWVAGERPVAEWVPEALARMLRGRAEILEDMARVVDLEIKRSRIADRARK